MKKLLLLLTVSFTLLLSACGEDLVEERTITCSAGGDDYAAVVVYQEDRVMLLREGEMTFIREYDLEYMQQLDVYFLEDYNVDTIFEGEDDLLDELEEMGYDCEISYDEVVYIEYDGEDEIPEEDILENAEKNSVLADAIHVENAAKLYCSQTVCDSEQRLTWSQIKDYLEGIDETDYDFTNNGGVVVQKNNGKWTVDLERAGTGEWEFTQGLTPSESTVDDVIEDLD